MKRPFALASALFCAFLAMPTSGIRAADGQPPQEEQPPPAEQPTLLVTPKAAIEWHEMEAARRANRDRALAARQQQMQEAAEAEAQAPATAQ